MQCHSAASAAFRKGIIGLALVVGTLPAYAVDGPLTLAEAQRRAIERSRQVAAQDYAATAAREMAVAASRLPDPVAKVAIDNLPVDGPDSFSLTRDFMTMRSVGVMQEFTRFEKRSARSKRFEREAEKSVTERAAVIANIRRDTALAWLDRSYAEAMAAIVSDQSRAARSEIEAAEAAYRAGRGSLADVLSARSVLVGLDDRASELTRRVATAKIALARWIGDEADVRLAQRPDIHTVRLDTRHLDRDALDHPEIAVVLRKEDLAAADVRVAQAERRVDWSVEVMFSYRKPNYSNMISLNVSAPLPWDRGNRQDREIAAKLAMLDQARAEREDAVRAHVAELRAMIAEWENQRERRARYERELAPLAAQRTEALTAAYRGAKASLTDVLMARRNEIDVRLQELELELDAARLWAKLNFLMADSTTSRLGEERAKDLP